MTTFASARCYHDFQVVQIWCQQHLDLSPANLWVDWVRASRRIGFRMQHIHHCFDVGYFCSMLHDNSGNFPDNSKMYKEWKASRYACMHVFLFIETDYKYNEEEKRETVRKGTFLFFLGVSCYIAIIRQQQKRVITKNITKKCSLSYNIVSLSLCQLASIVSTTQDICNICLRNCL